MKILVTGGAGYVGSVAVEEVLAAGHRALVFDNLSTGHRAAVPAGADFVRGDLAERAAIARVMDDFRPDAVMHFAALSLVGESYRQPLRYLRENVVCGLNLFESAVECGVRRFILSSTANLFGAPETVPIAEDQAVVPGSPYGESKHMLERCLHWLAQTADCRYASLRYFNASGASAERGEDHRPESHLIPIVLQVALGQRKDITIFGDDYDTPDGSCVRDYIHVSDLARAHLAALDALERDSCVYNLGNGHGYSVKEVIDVARAVTGHPIPAHIGARRAGDPAILVASNARIRHELGWQPEIAELEDIIASAWRWHRNHPDGYGD